LPKRRIKRNAGFTLLECLVVMSLLGLLFCIVGGFIVYVTAAYSRQSASHLLQSDLRYAMDYMVRELREAVSVVSITEDGSTITYTTMQQGQVVTRYFRLRGGAIQRHDNQPLCQFVESVRFSYDGNTAVVGIALQSVSTLPQSSTGSGLPYRLFTSVALRNGTR
jgi:prepilin-type N-terminal cleavage/methylation domain-containing protein